MLNSSFCPEAIQDEEIRRLGRWANRSAPPLQRNATSQRRAIRYKKLLNSYNSRVVLKKTKVNEAALRLRRPM